MVTLYEKTLFLLSTIALTNSVFADSKYSWSVGGSVPTSHYLVNIDSTITLLNKSRVNAKDWVSNSFDGKGFGLNAAFNYKVNDNINIGIEGLYYLKQPFGASLNTPVNDSDPGFSNIFVSPITLSGPVILANASWDIMNFNDKTSLYLTGGLGASYMSAHLPEVSITEEESTKNMLPKYKPNLQVAWKLGFGTVLKLSECHSIDIGYSFVSLVKVGIDNLDFVDEIPDEQKQLISADLDKVFNRLATHNINVSFRFDL